ncbi:MAG: hypothetical protein Q8P06_02310 [Candidatus Azambacteria bacterium]|nr:hypothetical protein [Candidatus Azambacteria bacterium]
MDDNQIEEIAKKQEETLILVQKLWKAEKWRRYLTIFRYVIYIGILFGAFYFLTPYIEKFTGLFQQIQDVKNPGDLQKILEQVK